VIPVNGVNELEILALVILVIIGIVIFMSRSNRRVTGEIGEKIVSRILQRLPADDYIILNDITIKNRSGTSQIDHLVISYFGIFVIETKCYKGWLFGSEEGEKWTQAFYTEKHKFYSPIQQIRGHIKALKYNLSKYSHIPYYPIIVLAGSCEFKSFDKVKTPVIYPDTLCETILTLSSQKFLTGSQVADIREILQNASIKGEGYRKLHIQNVRNKARIAENEIKAGTCPRCDGILIERKGKYGRFMGCSNYPKCKFIAKL
jgi:hypothetical protein